MEQMEDKILVQKAKEGDKPSFEALIVQNQKRIYNLAYRMMGNHEDALDVSQEAFFKAWQALPNFKGDSSFSTWLYRLTSNTAIDHLRKAGRKPTQSLTMTFPEDGEEIELEIPDTKHCPQEAFARKELQEIITKGLDILPDHHRQVLLMREMSGLSYQEISAALELDLGTVKSRIARARRNLRSFLQKEL